jgi:hypothetical protein
MQDMVLIAGCLEMGSGAPADSASVDGSQTVLRSRFAGKDLSIYTFPQHVKINL